jgi:hypothetical protein
LGLARFDRLVLPCPDAPLLSYFLLTRLQRPRSVSCGFGWQHDCTSETGRRAVRMAVPSKFELRRFSSAAKAASPELMMVFAKTIVPGCFTRITPRILNDSSEDEVDRQAPDRTLVRLQTRKRRRFTPARGLSLLLRTRLPRLRPGSGLTE